MPIISGGGGGGGGAPTTVREFNDYLAAFGVISESFPRPVASQSAAPASGELRVAAVPLHAGDAIGHVMTYVVSGPTNLTLARAAVYEPAALALVASSADTSGTSWAGGAWKSVALSATYNVTTTDVYYVGFLFVATAAPATACGLGVGGSDVLSPPNSNRLVCFRQTGLADLPNPIVEATGNIPHYVAVY